MRENDILGGVSVLTPEAQAATKDALDLQDTALGLKDIKDDTEYRAVDSMRSSIKQRLKEIDELRKSITKPLDEAKAKVMAFFRPAESALKASNEWLSGILIQYEDRQELKRREEERRLAAEAKKQAEESALAAAVAAEEAGESETADAILNDPIAAPPVRLASTVPKVGSYAREVWSAEVIDADRLIDDVAFGKAPKQALIPNMVFLNAQARALKNAMNYGGVRAVCTKIRQSKPS